MALSPWPTSPAALANAIETLRSLLGDPRYIRDAGGSEIDPDRLDLWKSNLSRMASVASGLVEKEALGAPQSVRDEALIRFVGYLQEANWGGIVQSQLGPGSWEYVTNHAPMFRNCGAKGLLSPWKVRHAGTIG